MHYNDMSEYVKNHQQLELHFRYFSRFTSVSVVADAQQPLQDLWLSQLERYVECKTDSHASGNICIELASNLQTLPELWEGRISANNWEEGYRDIVDYLRNVPDNKRGIGLDQHYLLGHLVSFAFPVAGQIFVIPMEQLQHEIVFPALREKGGEFTFGYSRSDAQEWYSINLLLPLSQIEKHFINKNRTI